MASFLLALAAIAPVLVAGNGLRGSPDTYVDSVQCTGSGALPERPMCFSGSVLVETFKIHVTSYDGEIGTVNMEAVGPSPAQCDGAQFENQNNVPLPAEGGGFHRDSRSRRVLQNRF
ncbi:Uncharacterized protein SCF082_LOCUS18364 [Durusdinium trenchii]|uniref:Uncharacterized protein n=1 Tax=Durusdinium trenchii TaxID=1381693 RepID=A0ABP0KNK6_9DINO